MSAPHARTRALPRVLLLALIVGIIVPGAIAPAPPVVEGQSQFTDGGFAAADANFTKLWSSNVTVGGWLWLDNSSGAGLWSPAPGILSVIANGAERARFNADGNLTVGTTAGVARLEAAVSGAGAILAFNRTDTSKVWTISLGGNDWNVVDPSGAKRLLVEDTSLGSGATTALTIAENGNICIAVAVCPDGRLTFAASTAAAGGILFGTDTTLYRSAVDTLKTDDDFRARSVAAEPAGTSTSTSFITRVSGDADWRFKTLADGTQTWGPGSGGFDTNLYRSAADQLKTDDAFTAGGTITSSAANVGFSASSITGTNPAVAVGIAAEGGNRAQWLGTGKLQWGGGAGTFDTNLYRAGVESLRTDSNFTVEHALGPAWLLVKADQVNVATADAYGMFQSAGGAGGDAFVRFGAAAVSSSWAVGQDTSDSQSFKITYKAGETATPGDTAYFKIKANGDAYLLGEHAEIGNAASGHVDDGLSLDFTMNAATTNGDQHIVRLCCSTLTKASSGTHGAFTGLALIAPVIAGGGASVTKSATLYVDGAMSGASNNYAIYSNSGANYFAGSVTAASGVDLTPTSGAASMSINPTGSNVGQILFRHGGSESAAIIKDAGQRLQFKVGNVDSIRFPGSDRIEFGSAWDTNLYRSAADTLKTDDALTVVGVLSSDSQVSAPVVRMSATTLPACDSTRRGEMRNGWGEAGIADTLVMCMKSAGDTYSWKTIMTG